MIKEERETTWVYDSGPVKVENVDLDNRHPYGNVPSPTEVVHGWKNELSEQGVFDWEVKSLDNGDFEIKYDSIDLDSDTIDWNITVDDYSCAPLAEICVSGDIHNHFVMYNSKNEMMVDIDLDDGTIIFGDTYTPDEAAKTFWDTVGKMSNRSVEESIEEYKLMEDDIRLSAPPGIADDMPEEYITLQTTQVEAVEPLTGWTLTEEECVSEVDEDLVKEVVKDIQATHFDNTMKGLIDG